MTKNVTFFDCSLAGSRHLRNMNNIQDMFACPIYVVPSEDSILERDIGSCGMMFQLVSPVQAYQIQGNEIGLTWQWPQPKSDVEKHKTTIIPAIVTPGSIMLAFLFIVSLFIYHYFKKKGGDQDRLEKFMENY